LLKEKKYVTFANIIPWLSLHSVGALMMPNRFGGTAAQLMPSKRKHGTGDKEPLLNRFQGKAAQIFLTQL